MTFCRQRKHSARGRLCANKGRLGQSRGPISCPRSMADLEDLTDYERSAIVIACGVGAYAD